MPPLKPNHNPIFKHILMENLKGIVGESSPEEALQKAIHQTIKDFELVPIMYRDVKVSIPLNSDADISFGGSLKHLLDRGRLGFCRGRGIEEVIAEKSVVF